LPPADADGSERPGIYYLCDERDVTFEQLGDLVAATLGAGRVRHVCLPAVLCWPLAAGGSWYGRWRSKKTFFNLDKMREATAGSWVCSGARAARELGFSPARPLAERLEETEHWYTQMGWL
jgi:nucleoside-diphosphate-sugar epimerase